MKLQIKEYLVLFNVGGVICCMIEIFATMLYTWSCIGTTNIACYIMGGLALCLLGKLNEVLDRRRRRKRDERRKEI